MKKCKTCTHWRLYAEEFPNGEHQDNEQSGGYCHCDKLVEKPWVEEGFICKPDMLIYPYREGCEAFWTGPDFGCVHHTER